MEATIKGVYDTELNSGVPYINRNGDNYWKVLLVTEEDEAIYEVFTINNKSIWKFEALYKSVGKICPKYEDLDFSDIQELIGDTVNVKLIRDGEYMNVSKWIPKAADVKVESVAPAKPDNGEIPGYDPDLDEDVPF